MKNLNISNLADLEAAHLLSVWELSLVPNEWAFWAKQAESQKTKEEGIGIKVQNGNSDSNRNYN